MGQIVRGDRVVVGVSREMVEAKEWLNSLSETGSQFNVTTWLFFLPLF